MNEISGFGESAELNQYRISLMTKQMTEKEVDDCRRGGLKASPINGVMGRVPLSSWRFPRQILTAFRPIAASTCILSEVE